MSRKNDRRPDLSEGSKVHFDSKPPTRRSVSSNRERVSFKAEDRRIDYNINSNLNNKNINFKDNTKRQLNNDFDFEPLITPSNQLTIKNVLDTRQKSSQERYIKLQDVFKQKIFRDIKKNRSK